MHPSIHTAMVGRKHCRVLPPAEEVDISAAHYNKMTVQAPHLTGFKLRLFVWLVESALGPVVLSFLKRKNNLTQILKETLIPERPMIRPEYPPQDEESGVLIIRIDGDPSERCNSALSCLPDYNPSRLGDAASAGPFLYWTIRDYAHAYRTQLTTPSIVAEHIISIVDDYNNREPSMPLLISFDASDVREQAAASTQRFIEGKPLSIMDGIFMAVKDDIDCYPYPTKSGTTWLHEVRNVRKDAVCVSRLRSSGVVFMGKANMHELGLGTTGSNPHYGTVRNPYAVERYPGGSSSGAAAIVACGMCPAALGTDGGGGPYAIRVCLQGVKFILGKSFSQLTGSIRIPSSLCGIVGLKTNYGRTDMKGVVCDGGTVDVVGPIAATVEDAMLVYSVMAGASPADTICLKPAPLSLPKLSASDKMDVLGALRLGKYEAWFSDVYSPEISDKCKEALNLLSETRGCRILEIKLPELPEVTIAHMASIGSESLCSINADLKDGRLTALSLDTRTSVALFNSLTAAEYVAAQRLRRRMMYYHLETFKNVDVIVTPTTGMTAPIIPPDSLKCGETNFAVTAYLMRFVVAANLLGFPAITVPICHDKQGLPIGLQLIGRPWGEATILRLASAIEELCLPSRQRPSAFYDVLKRT